MNAFLRSLKWTAAAVLFVCLSMPAAAQDFRVACSTTNTFLLGQEREWVISFTTEGVDGEVFYTWEDNDFPEWLSTNETNTNALCFIVGDDAEVGTNTVSVLVACNYADGAEDPVAVNTFDFTFIVINETTVTPQICGQGWGWNETDSAKLTDKSRWILAEKDDGYVGFFLNATNAIGSTFDYQWTGGPSAQGASVTTLSVDRWNSEKGGFTPIGCEVTFTGDGGPISTSVSNAWYVSVRNPPTFDGDYLLEVFDEDGNNLDTLMERAQFKATFTNANATAGVAKWSLLPQNAYSESSADSTFGSDVGTAMGWKADEGFWKQTIPFSFPFYDDDYTTLWIDSNGRILLGDYYGEAIDVLFGDLTTEEGDIHVDTNATDHVTIRWEAKYVEGGTPVNASATLYSDGRIVLAYGEGNAGGGTIGLHSGIRDLDSDSLLEHPSKSGSGSMETAKDIVFTPGVDNSGMEFSMPSKKMAKSTSDKGELSGSFATFGTYNFVVVARGDCGATARTVSFDVAKNPAIRHEPTCDPAVGDINLEGATNQTFSVTATTSSTVTFAWSVDGVNATNQTNSAVDISDFTESFAYVVNDNDLGSHTIRCEVSDDGDPDNVTNFEWRVYSLVVENQELPEVTEGYAIDETVVPVRGATGGYTLKPDGKPEWLTCSLERGGDVGDGWRLCFSGRPMSDTAEEGSFTIDVTDSFGETVTATITYRVLENPNKEPTVKNPRRSQIDLPLGETIALEVEVTDEPDDEGDELAYLWHVDGGVQAGTANNTFEFSQEAEGRYTVRCDVVDGVWTNSISWLIRVGDYPVIDTETLTNAKENESYSVSLEAHGGETNYAWATLPYAEQADESSYAPEKGSQAFLDGDDELTGFGFLFPFDGERHYGLRVNRNGTITFGDDSFGEAATGDPDADRETFLGHRMIAVLWGSIDTNAVDIYVACEDDSCTFAWRGSDTMGGKVNASATLHKDGRIVLSYGDGNELGGIIGVSLGDGATCVESVWSETGTMNRADDIVFVPASVPEGLSLDEESGTLSGTPAKPGEYMLSLLLTDANGNVATKAIPMVVEPDIPNGHYRVYFDANGGEGAMEPLTTPVAEPAALPTNTYTYAKHLFLGWATNDFGKVVYKDGETVTDLAGTGEYTTLYAVWGEDVYRVVFDANGGEGTMDPVTLVVGDSAALPTAAFTRTGHVFQGWATSDVGEATYADGATVKDLADFGESITLYAAWKASVYTVALDAAGGEGGTTAVSASYGGAMPAITVPVLAGYSFGGYFTEVGGAGTQYYAANGAGARSWDGTADATLHAWWIPTRYTVSFNGNGGDGWMGGQAIDYGILQALSKNAFTRSGYVFIGWALSADGAVAFGDEEWVQNLSVDGGTVTLYAKWAKKYYKVKFYANGGKGKMTTEKMTYGKAKKLYKNKFQREGYTFKGWAKSKKLAKKGKVAYKNKKKVKNLTTTGKTVKLYAVWKKRR